MTTTAHRRASSSVTRLLFVGILSSLAIGAAAAVVVYLVTLRIDPTYASQATVLVSPPVASAPSFDEASVPAYSLEVFAAAATTDDAIQRVVRRLFAVEAIHVTADTVRGAVAVSIERAQNPTTGFVTISARTESAQNAPIIANAVAEELVTWHSRRTTAQLAAALQDWEKRLEALDRRIESLSSGPQVGATSTELIDLRDARAEAALRRNLLEATEPVNRIEVFAPARARASVVAPNPQRNAAVAFALAVLVNYGVFLARRLDGPAVV